MYGLLQTASNFGTASKLDFTFDANAMFEWANIILQAMTPVLYITLGISLGFVIIRSLRSAFA